MSLSRSRFQANQPRYQANIVNSF